MLTPTLWAPTYEPFAGLALALSSDLSQLNMIVAAFALLIMTVAAVTCLMNARANDPVPSFAENERLRERLAWALLGVAALAALSGRAIFFYLTNISASSLEQSMTGTVLVGSAFIFVFGAIIVMPWTTCRGQASTLLTDASIMASALATLSWPLILGPYLSGDMTLFARNVDMILLISFSLVLLVCSLGFGLRNVRPELKIVAILISIAIALMFGGVFGYFSLANANEANLDPSSSFIIINLSIIAVFSLIAISALERSRRIRYGQTANAEFMLPERSGSSQLWPLVVPYVFVIVSLIATIALDLATARPDYRSGMLICLGITIILLLVRLLMTLRSNTVLLQLVNERSVRDSLTGLYNHPTIYWWLEQEVIRAHRTDAPVSVLFMDIDYFKRYNDTFGHPAGDRLLKRVSEVIQQVSRTTDFVGRYGGEEFVVVAPNADRDGARHLAGRIQRAVAMHRTMENGQSSGVTMSIGTATFPHDARDATSLIARADEALYRAKSAGRNRIVMTDAEPQTAANSVVPQLLL